MVNPYFEINGRKIGLDYPPLVIAELGINHGGSLDTAFRMVDAAERAGVEIIKHQTHVVDDEMSKVAKTVIPGHTKESIYEIMESCSLDEYEEIELQKYIESKGIIFFSTAFSRAAADRLNSMNVSAFKIGSGECNNYPLVEHISSFGKPVIISTGMNTIESIKPSVEILEKSKIPYALLHCTNVYPTPPELVRLGALDDLKSSFPNAVIGLSDHTISNHACFGAVALGASILERHFTDRMDREGPDIVCSMDPESCSELITGSLIIFKERGGHKGPVEEEQPTIDFAFSTVVSIAPISKGEKLSKENIWVKRPGTGKILAKDFKSLLGKKAKNDIYVDKHLDWSDFE